MSKVKKKVTIIDILKEQKPETMIYIGTIDGSGWIFIEQAGVMLEHMSDMDESLKQDAVTKYDRAETCLALYPRFIVNLQEETHDKSLTSEDLNSKKQKLAKAEKRYVSAYHSRKRYGKLLKHWIPLSQREVIGVREHKTDYVGVSIIIKGFENGTLWTKDELDNGGEE